ncbi:MAG: CapA family protein [Clostridium sp.]|nr:CapA family protein [Clostridium sp.]
MSILIGADLVPTKSNMEFFESGNITELIDERLIVELNQARYRIFNLEVPLVDKETPIKKCGPNLIAPTQSVLGIKKLGVNFFTLANNHILDQGEEGLFSTINTLTDAGIAFAGAGNTLEEASKPFIFEFNGKKVGVYCCAEHEFSILSESRAGANPFDPLESLDHVQDLKNKTDYVIVLYHGGKEHYRYPSPYLQRVCRKMIEKGANLVICQHTHCIGCEEKYKSGTIVYGQGNFLFDMSENEYWQTSIVIRIKDNFEIEYIPLKKNGLKVQIPDKRESKLILKEFMFRSMEIKKQGFIEKKYDEFSDEIIWNYMSVISGKSTKNILFRIINKISKYKFSKWYIKRKYSSNDKLALINYLECEAHRELFERGLRRLI